MSVKVNLKWIWVTCCSMLLNTLHLSLQIVGHGPQSVVDVHNLQSWAEFFSFFGVSNIQGSNFFRLIPISWCYPWNLSVPSSCTKTSQELVDTRFFNKMEHCSKMPMWHNCFFLYSVQLKAKQNPPQGYKLVSGRALDTYNLCRDLLQLEVH